MTIRVSDASLPSRKVQAIILVQLWQLMDPEGVPELKIIPGVVLHGQTEALVAT